MQQRIREIPYNYTSFSDHEIVSRLMGEEWWQVINDLRDTRRTGRSARMLFGVLGEIWAIKRNPYLQDDLIANRRRLQQLVDALQERLVQIKKWADDNQRAIDLQQAACSTVNDFESWIVTMGEQRVSAKKALKKVTSKTNIDFSGLARVSHTTDATDWRVELPFVVISPDTEAEIPQVVKTCIDLGFTIIARGGGTGYTGGAIPLYENTAVINCEKLEAIGGINYKTLAGSDLKAHTITAEAGVVTMRLTERAVAQKLAFAVDPTSQEASTIGGNIAMNAGGKKAVLWGTTLDNLTRWKMVTPDAHWMDVERINHNMGKIHEQETVHFKITKTHRDTGEVLGDIEELSIKGSLFRKVGLGKDVTDKFMGGVPGIQKEGCDGLITSAEFVLHEVPNYMRTVCLEFFNQDSGKDVSAIVEIKDKIDKEEGVILSGLEHLDARYVKAVQYTTKSTRQQLPKMVLVADIMSNDENALAAICSTVVEIANKRGAEGFIAVSPAARAKFWEDRKRTAAISAHTNAFKINEDVVIPLENLSHYNRGIEILNIRESIKNKITIVLAIKDHLINLTSIEQAKEDADDIEINKFKFATDILSKQKNEWEQWLDHFETPAQQFNELKDFAKDQSVIDCLINKELLISYKTSVKKVLDDIFSGLEFVSLREEIASIHAKHRDSRLFIALHMHAGDGNVHTNIPVHSDNYEMLHQAEKIVDEIMALTLSLDGVVSGEHGIGLTKIQYLDDEKLESFKIYKEKIDPNGYFNKGKLLKGSGLKNAYTPSLKLVQQEAIILEHSELSEINNSIKNCLRCGKCKPVCMTHIPRANLLYSPRNKILATGVIIESFLYEEQTRRGVSIKHFAEMNDVADHCTTCHKCLNPCPVNIDFGDVSIKMRQVLVSQGKKRKSLGGMLALWFLNRKDPFVIDMAHKLMLDWGFKGVRLANKVVKMAGLFPRKKIPKSSNKVPKPNQQVINFVRNPVKANVPSVTMRQMLGLNEANMVPIIRNPKTPADERDSVFYFPGCGSERLFSQVGIATISMLYEAGARTVLPPGYLCCGYPQLAAGQYDKGQSITAENRVLFHRIANTLNYLDIKTIVVSCGTCLDQMQKYEFEAIFPGSRILDIHEYLYEKGIKLNQETDSNYIMHDPCHSPIVAHDPIKVASRLMSQPIELTKRCCGEAGTLATTRPDIALQLHARKKEEIEISIANINKIEPNKSKTKCLTTCPACVQGLSRYEEETGVSTDYIVVEMAEQIYGKDWLNQFNDKLNNGGIERVLL